jgi:hypothetical protein
VLGEITALTRRSKGSLQLLAAAGEQKNLSLVRTTGLVKMAALGVEVAQKGLPPDFLLLAAPGFPAKATQVETDELEIPELRVVVAAERVRPGLIPLAAALEKAAMVFRPQSRVLL